MFILKRFELALFCIFIFSLATHAQIREIDGTIYAFNKYPLKNVSVGAKKSKQTTTTDENGTFKIQVKEKDQIIIEAEGFVKFTYRIKSNEPSIKVNLIFNDTKKNIDLAVNREYISKEHLHYGLNNLADENNVYSSFIDVYDAVVYAIPAAKIINENGTRKFQLRGVNTTTGSNAALMVVNGYLNEDISFIIPSNIISIKQMRPSAASIYGTGSGNGVIEIKTK